MENDRCFAINVNPTHVHFDSRAGTGMAKLTSAPCSVVVVPQQRRGTVMIGLAAEKQSQTVALNENRWLYLKILSVEND